MNKDVLLSELHFKATRSSGAGGQNVNKVASKVVLTFDLNTSLGLNEEEKLLLKEKWATRLTQDDVLILHCDEERSQFKNKGIVTKRFFSLLENGLKRPTPRKKTKTPRKAVEKRLNAKKVMSVLKQNRKKPNF